MLSYEYVETEQSIGKGGSVGYMCIEQKQKETGSREDRNSLRRGR
jgi:hypothetical protein